MRWTQWIQWIVSSRIVVILIIYSFSSLLVFACDFDDDKCDVVECFDNSASNPVDPFIHLVSHCVGISSSACHMQYLKFVCWFFCKHFLFVCFSRLCWCLLLLAPATLRSCTIVCYFLASLLLFSLQPVAGVKSTDRLPHSRSFLIHKYSFNFFLFFLLLLPRIVCADVSMRCMLVMPLQVLQLQQRYTSQSLCAC